MTITTEEAEECARGQDSIKESSQFPGYRSIACRAAATIRSLAAERDALQARVEGCQARPFPGPWWQGYRDLGDGELFHQQAVGETPPDWMIEPKQMSPTPWLDQSARDGFRSIWMGLHGPDAWQANPWVWVIEFERVKP